MFRLSLLISILLLSFTLHNRLSAAAIYTPGATIAMTGSNNSVRFDIASDLFGYDATIPTLTTVTRTFTGVFYGSGIGWIEFSTGTYQVGLDCGVQSLDALSTDCSLTGTGWNENVGDIYFNSGSTITYNPTTGYLSGSAISFVGDIDLTGIALPLRPVTINESVFIANHSMNITVSGSSLYNGGNGVWNIHTLALGAPYPIDSSGDSGNFSAVDLSLATTYSVTITDTNGSTTQFPITVNSGLPTTSLTGTLTYVNAFCAANSSDPIHCPDGATRIASSLDKSPGGSSVVADGTDTYNFTMKVRDEYGNRVSTGNIAIKYTTTVKNIQTILGENTNYSPSNDGDAVIGDFANILGESTKTYGSLISDITYSIASSAPTNTIDNIIKLDSIKYISGSTSTDFTPTNPSPFLIFSPLFIASTTSPDTPMAGSPNTFETAITINGTTTIVPDIITTLRIGGGTGTSEWRSLSSIPAETCTKYPFASGSDNLCEWDNDKISIIATHSGSDFIFTGTYTTGALYTFLEPTTIGTYIYYQSGGTDILYPLPDSIINDPTLTTPRLRVLGQTSNGMGMGSQNRVNIINSLREKISLLARNHTDYSTADYTIYTGDHTITDATFADKRTIISVGGDITISSNISLRGHPLAIIALTDANNNGGDIIINSSVTDIHSTLIAEHGIISPPGASTSQLYIHGSMISSNPPQEVAPLSCPYFAPGCTISNYDLPDSRKDYVSPVNSSLSGSLYDNPLVIEYDTRLIGDPPPVMSK